MTHAYAGAISTKDAGGTNGTLNILLKFVPKFCLNLVDLKGFVKENKLFRLTAQRFQNHKRNTQYNFGTFLKIWVTKECKQQTRRQSVKIKSK